MQYKSENVLVTGGGGFLGKAIVKALVARGDQVTSFSRGFYPELETLKVRQIQGDIADPGAAKTACEGMDAVYHVAAKAGVWGPFQEFYRANVLGTENILAACREKGVQRLIYTSSPSVVFDSNDMEGVNESVPYPEQFHAPYPETKAMAEKKVRAASGCDTIILRPHLIWGPGDNHLLPGIVARAKQLRRIGSGTNVVDTIYVDNAAQAHVLAGDALKKNASLSGNIYFISQDDPIALWEMVDHFLKAAGLPPVQGSVSGRTAYWAGAILEVLFKIFPFKTEPPMTRFAARELATSHWFDISRAKQDLGYVPLVSTHEGLKRMTAWLNENPQRVGVS
ncbi:Nucleoside-diphosphate-sugar epimerase [Desulfocicer vacuolatum DSM 3385]|uniref:Nucleoside-diphosphate-sugar epimerase n=1 Tax=Desulfocicer vacuolatum DSM 3385 TaxID=1121400 RepID=A0A1W2BRS7_9BACT|nr:NAD-dependent epimerase/dehydratase family protein [Desulfocicer vacuolatum]SMC75687.1 Nucleoside-diphosphate-sugar epimerase [Desulfocicer vacuolatum DSM 3385]